MVLILILNSAKYQISWVNQDLADISCRTSAFNDKLFLSIASYFCPLTPTSSGSLFSILYAGSIYSQLRGRLEGSVRNTSSK